METWSVIQFKCTSAHTINSPLKVLPIKHLWDATYDDIEGDNKPSEHTNEDTCCKDSNSNKFSSSYDDSKANGS
jgi:hypothetical protein